MPRCPCGKSYLNKSGLNRHKADCPTVASASARVYAAVKQRRQDDGPASPKRPRISSDIPGWLLPRRSAGLNHGDRTSAADPQGLEGGPGPSSDAGFGSAATAEARDDEEMHTAHTFEALSGFDSDTPGVPSTLPSSDELRTRTGRRVRPTWKVRDQLPEDVGADSDAPESEPVPPAALPSQPRSRPRLLLLATDYVRTAANAFGLRRFYKRRPQRPPRARTDLEACYAPTADTAAAMKSRRSLAQIIFPFPNISSWRFAWHYSRSYKKTQADRDDMRSLINRDDFVAADTEHVNFRLLDEKLAAGVTHDEPWSDEREGWRTSSVTIGIPLGKKSTQASRRQAAAAANRLRRHEYAEDTPAEHAVPGLHYTVPNFHHKSICAEIVKTFSSDPAARDFVYDPYIVEHQREGSSANEQVHGELYNSPAFVQEDLRLQNAPREPGCDLPRAIAALMFWSDATVVSQFGNQKAWPGYMYYGNQSKYTRARPTARAAHHIAYFVPLPDDVQDYIRDNNDGKPPSANLLTHCRRELFHGQWACVIDDEFVHAYEHGIVVDCIDGVRRRLYPRIFTYSADYPEKMLLATLRDKGRCPCPRCLTTFDRIDRLGTPEDIEARKLNTRAPTAEQDRYVQEARELIYDSGYVVNSDHVEALLREQSLVPTRNAFARLEPFGFNLLDALVVDQLHEFELGVWKAIFSQLVRILESVGSETVHELNKRFRQVPSFAWTTIRRFANNVCEMKRLAARDFEDILQCIIPCFEGLLPEAHNNAVLTLLFVAAYWHALAKMRMHTETSLGHLDDATAVLGFELRHFAFNTCPAFNTRETQTEYDARKRAEARRQTVPQTGTLSGRRPRTFNLNTVKLHFLGDYLFTIRRVGTTDSYTTQIGEHEHRRVKARRQRTNGVSADGQVVNLDVRESRMHQMAHELHELGLDIPGLAFHPGDTAEPVTIPPSAHHHIGDTEKNIVNLGEWQAQNADDPAVRSFVPLMKAHLRERMLAAYPSLGNEDIPVIIRHDRVYRHAFAYFNYTTYDLQRDQDIIHPSTDKSDVLVHSPAADSSNCGPSYPWLYARVLGVYHVNVLPPGETQPHRYEFLHVRWFEHDNTHLCGARARRLDRIRFVSDSSGDAFGIIDPAHVIRACHLIPAFHHGRTKEYLPASALARDPEGDWQYYYVNRFVDRDTFVRYLGCGIGHLDLRANATESLKPPGFDPSVPVHVVQATAASQTHPLLSRCPDSSASLAAPQPSPSDDEQEYEDEDEDDLSDETEGLGLEDADLDWVSYDGTKDGGPRASASLPGTITAMPPLAPPPSESVPSGHSLPPPRQLQDNLSALNSVALPRPRPASDSDSNVDEIDSSRPPKKKTYGALFFSRKHGETALMAIGVAVGMMGDLFRDFETILTIGIRVSPSSSHSPSSTLSYRERKYQQLYQHILALAPWIIDEIEKRGPRGPMEVARELSDGRQGVRGTDLHSIKRAILAWNTYTPPIPADAKSVRGFNHPECGRLLCPVKYDWSKRETRQALQNRDKEYPCGATEWPAVLWEDERMNSSDMQAGFLRNVRLIKASIGAGRYVLLGPRTVNETNGKVAAKKPKAKIYGIRSITVPFMAYTAVLVHCSLNSQESFSDGSVQGTFPYERFYQSIVRFVEEKFLEEDRKDLISWWNREIYGNAYDDEEFCGSGGSDEDRQYPSVMAMMEAQIAARVQAAQASSENASRPGEPSQADGRDNSS
ncbi:hypothetical protein ACG7TL_004360 [Trametes sanguinea]